MENTGDRSLESKPNRLSTVPNTPTKDTITLRTSRRAWETLAAQSAKRFTSYHPQPPLLRPKQPSLLLPLRNHNQRRSTMPSLGPVWPAASSSNNKMPVPVKTLSQPPWKSMRSPVSVLVKLDLHKTLRSRVNSSQAGAQPSIPT